MNKLKSRKFWMCAGAFLFSAGSYFVANITDNKTLQMVSLIMIGVSAGCYAIAEALVDSSAAGSNTTNTSITSTTIKKDA